MNFDYENRTFIKEILFVMFSALVIMVFIHYYSTPERVTERQQNRALDAEEAKVETERAKLAIEDCSKNEEMYYDGKSCVPNPPSTVCEKKGGVPLLDPYDRLIDCKFPGKNESSEE